jgi:hypothetical protein
MQITLPKEPITKAEFAAEMKSLRIEFDSKIEKLNTKLNFLIALMIIALTLMNL